MNACLYVIVPVYNCESFLRRCIDSIICQSFTNFQLLLIDDGSIDESSNICDYYSKNDKRIITIHKPHSGPSSTRNIGLDYIKNNNGKYVCFIDSDDFVESDYFLTLINKMNDNDSDIVCSSYYYYSNGKSSISYVIKNGTVTLDSFSALQILFRDNELKSMCHHKLFKAILWENIRFPEDLFFMEDTATLFKTFIQANKIVLSDYAGYYYNQDNNNSIMRKTIENNKIISGWNALKEVYNYDFDVYNYDQIKVLKQLIINLMGDYFLELYPRLNFKQNKEQILIIKKDLKNYNVVKLFQPYNKKQFIKKYVYILSPHFYRYLFYLYMIIKKVRKY